MRLAAVCSGGAVSVAWTATLAGRLSLGTGARPARGPPACLSSKQPGADLLCSQLLSQAPGLLPSRGAAGLAGQAASKLDERKPLWALWACTPPSLLLPSEEGLHIA